MSALFVGYARCSTDQQDLTAQRDGLLGLGVEADRIYVDHGLTGTNRERPGLREALAACRAEDTLVVTKLDGLARSLPAARAIADELTTRRISLSLGGSAYDPNDAVGRLLFNVLAMVAEFESDLIRLRTREGMKARHPRASAPECSATRAGHTRGAEDLGETKRRGRRRSEEDAGEPLRADRDRWRRTATDLRPRPDGWESGRSATREIAHLWFRAWLRRWVGPESRPQRCVQSRRVPGISPWGTPSAPFRSHFWPHRNMTEALLSVRKGPLNCGFASSGGRI